MSDVSEFEDSEYSNNNDNNNNNKNSENNNSHEKKEETIKVDDGMIKDKCIEIEGADEHIDISNFDSKDAATLLAGTFILFVCIFWHGYVLTFKIKIFKQNILRHE